MKTAMKRAVILAAAVLAGAAQAQTTFYSTNAASFTNNFSGTPYAWTNNLGTTGAGSQPLLGGSNNYVLTMNSANPVLTNDLGTAANGGFRLNALTSSRFVTLVPGAGGNGALVFMNNDAGVGPTIGNGASYFTIWNNLVLSNSLTFTTTGNGADNLYGAISGTGDITNNKTASGNQWITATNSNSFAGNWILNSSGIRFTSDASIGSNGTNGVTVNPRASAYFISTTSLSKDRVVNVSDLGAFGGNTATLGTMTNGVNVNFAAGAIVVHTTANSTATPIGITTNDLVYGMAEAASGTALTGMTIGTTAGANNWRGVASLAGLSLGAAGGTLTLSGDADLDVLNNGTLTISNQITGGSAANVLRFRGLGTVVLQNVNDNFSSMISGDSAASITFGYAPVAGVLAYTFADGNNSFATLSNPSNNTLALTGGTGSTNTLSGTLALGNAGGTTRVDGGTFILTGVPSGITNTLVQNGGNLVLLAGRYFTPAHFILSNGTVTVRGDRMSTTTPNGVIDIVGGSLLVTNTGGAAYGWRIGDDANGVAGANINYTVNQGGGSVVVANGGGIQMGGTTANTTNFYNFSGGAINSAGLGLVAAANAVTRFTMSGGNLTNSAATMTVGGGAEFLMYGGLLTNSSSLTMVGSGMFVQTGGVVVVNGIYGNSAGRTGSIVLSGGAFTNSNTGTGGAVATRGSSVMASNAAVAYFASADTRVASDGYNGTWTLTNGSPSVTVNSLKLNSPGATAGVISTGMLNLAAGMLTVNAMDTTANPTNLVIVNFNGGTLRFAAAATLSSSSAYSILNVLGGGAILDTMGYTVTINKAFTNGVAGLDGGLTKLGTGTLLLGDTNTFTGGTVIQQGALMLAANYPSNLASSAVTVWGAGGIGTTGAVDSTFLTWLNGKVQSGTVVTGTVLSGANMAGGLMFSNALSNAFLGAQGAAVSVTNGVAWSDSTIRLGGGNSNLIYLAAIGGATNVIIGQAGGTPASVVLSSGNNTFSGGLNIVNGKVAVNVAGATNYFGTGPIVLGDSSGSNAATLYASVASSTVILFTNALTVAAGSTGPLTIGGANANMAFSGPFSLNNNLALTNENIGKLIAFSGKLTETSAGSPALTITAAGGLTGPTTLSGGVEIGSGGLTLANNSSQAFTVGPGNITATTTGDLVFRANSNGAFTVSAAGINNSGNITNSGAGSGTTSISGSIGPNVANVIQNSATSQLTLSGPNSFSGNLYILAGTVGDGGGTVNPVGYYGTGAIYLGDTGGSANATVKTGVNNPGAITNALIVRGGSTNNILALDQSGNANNNWNGPVTLNHDLTLLNTSGYAKSPFLAGPIGGTGNIIISLSGVGLWNITSTSINNAGAITNNGAGTGTATISGNLGANVQGVVQNSTTSLLTLSGTNTAFIGPVTINAGTLQVGKTTALNVNNVVTVNTGGTNDVQNGVTIAGLNDVGGAGGIVLNNKNNSTNTLTVGGSGAYGFAGSLQNGTNGAATTLALTKTGTGIQILSGANTYSGPTTIGAGILQVGNGGTSGSLGSGGVTNNGALWFNRSDDLTVANAIAGTGTLVKAGSGTLQFSAVNPYTGNTVISNGTLQLGASGSIGNSPLIHLASPGSTVDVSMVSGGFHLLAGQQLKGVGTVQGGLIMDPGAQLNPGNSPGTLNVSGNLTLATGTTNYFDLIGPNSSDLVVVGGTLNLGGIQFTDFAWNPDAAVGTNEQTYTLFHSSGGAVAGSLGAVTNGLVNGSTAYLHTGGAGNDELQLTVIPEPGTVGLLGLWAAAVLWRRRRRG